MMLRRCVQIVLVTGVLVGVVMVPEALAQTDTPGSVGVIVTIITLDAKKGMALLQTDDGEVFELPKGWRWKVGDQMACDRIAAAPRGWLQNCRPWTWFPRVLR
jgi:hypothetical protein